jgi:hypothetical protein
MRNSSWISVATWTLIDQKAAARKRGDAATLRVLKKSVQRALRKDRRARAAAAAATATAYLGQGQIRKAFGAIKGWYKDVGPRPHKPSREDINITRAEYENLFAEEEPCDDPIPLHIEAVPVNDEPPTEDEVVESVRKLRNNKASGATGITAENVKGWLEGARPTEDGVEPDPTALLLWEKLLEIVRLAFAEGEIPQAFSQGIFVLIPKDKAGEFRGIALLEIIYKLISSIINQRLCSKINLHDALHGFRKKRGTGTAIMEAKLLAQLRCRLDEPLYMIFIDLKKAYDTLDRSQAMRILEGYGVGANILRIIATIWEGDTMVPRQAGYFGRAFKARRGVRQGDIVSPFIFNIMVDAVVRHWEHIHQPQGSAEMALFYADDGLITSTDPARAQAAMDIITQGFASLGLKMNATKTEFMVMTGGRHTVRMSTVAYNRSVTGDGLTWKERRKVPVQCLKCGGTVVRESLARHQTSAKCKKANLTYQPPTPVRERVAVEQAITPVGVPTSYTTSIPGRHTEAVRCPVTGCEYQVRANDGSKRTSMRHHFRGRHIEDTIVIEEEGQLPQCRLCGFFAKGVDSEAHRATQTCTKYAEHRRQHFQAKRQTRAREEVTFQVGGQEINRVSQFRYLGRILEEDDNDVYAASRQLSRAKAKWGRLGNVLRSEGATSRTMGYFYKAIIQSVLLYGSESWTLTDHHLQKFRSFHARVARCLTGRHIRCLEDGTWVYPPTQSVLADAGLESIDEYIRRRRQTVRSFARHLPIYEECRLSTAFATNVKKTVWWKLN